MNQNKNQHQNFQTIPNTARVIVKLLTNKDMLPSKILMPGQLKAGENLLFGEIVSGGKTQFQPGDLIYYSEYSASLLIQLGKVKRGEITLGEAQKEENHLFIVAEDDIMAFEKAL